MIKFETYAGLKIKTKSSRTALILWFLNISQNIARKKIDELFITDDPDLFLVQIASCIERTYNTNIELNHDLSYESNCVRLLEIIYEIGNIKKLRIN